MNSRFLPIALSAAALLSAVVGSCGSDDADATTSSPDASCNTPSCLEGGADVEPDQVTSDVVRPDVEQPDGTVPLLELCGTGCQTTDENTALFPGDPEACVGTGTAGAGGAPGELNCIVTRGEAGAPTSECSPAGDGLSGDPCIKASDCAVGYACVGEDNAGQCRPFCCSDPEACDPDTFCAAQPLLEQDPPDGQEPLLVPVCIEAHGCRLDEPFPCPQGESCTCEEGLACTVVRADGTTGCVTPGQGTEGEPCPCAAATESSLGYVCSQAYQTCVKLCAVSTNASGCGVESRCQASASLPTGFGVCTASYNNDAGTP